MGEALDRLKRLVPGQVYNPVDLIRAMAELDDRITATQKTIKQHLPLTCDRMGCVLYHPEGHTWPWEQS